MPSSLAPLPVPVYLAAAQFAGRCAHIRTLSTRPRDAADILLKIFLLFKDESDAGWSQILHEARSKYGEQRDHLLRFIKHPEALAELTLDPLADDPDVSGVSVLSTAHH